MDKIDYRIFVEASIHKNRKYSCLQFLEKYIIVMIWDRA